MKSYEHFLKTLWTPYKITQIQFKKKNVKIIGLVQGKIYRRPWFLPSKIGFSCNLNWAQHLPAPGLLWLHPRRAPPWHVRRTAPGAPRARWSCAGRGRRGCRGRRGARTGNLGKRWGDPVEIWVILVKNHRKTMGKPWENQRKTIGSGGFQWDFMGFSLW